MARAFALLLLLGLAGRVYVHAQDTASIIVQFDNRGSKVMDKTVNARITKALADSVFLVPVSQVVMVGGLGQSTLLNHQSVVTYKAIGPAKNGRPVYLNCEAAVKSSIWSSSIAYKAIKKATDSWMPGDKVKVKAAKCSRV